MEPAFVRVDIFDSTLVITLNRPEIRNAVDLAMAHAIAAAIDRLDNDEGLAIGIITGAGGTFCAGMNLKEFARGVRPSLPGRGFAGLVERPAEKPLIAAVEGHALAGGCEIALSCDLIVAGRGARFGVPEVKRGLVAAGGALIRLPQRIPSQIAAELALTGDLIDAERAYHVGLVNRLVDSGQAMSEALELAARIASNGPLAVQATKQILREAPDWQHSEAFDRQRAISEPVLTSADALEGARAFAAGRAPKWTGR